MRQKRGDSPIQIHTFHSILLFMLLFVFVSCGEAPKSSSPTPSATNQSGSGSNKVTEKSSIAGLTLPSGFQISTYATGLHAPRFLAIGPHGVLLVADRNSGSIVALPAGDSLAHAGTAQSIVTGLNDPTSLVWDNGMLYVGEFGDIARISLSDDLHAGPIERIINNLPQGAQHVTHTVLIGPDQHIYVANGSSCNVCIETDPQRASVWIYDMDGSHGRLFSKGLRNAVGLAVNPWTKEIWIDVNGRDELGNDVPPETVYNLKDNADYGWPRCHAGAIVDPQFGQGTNSCQGVEQPLVKMQAHSAPLGMTFSPPTGTNFPAKYYGSSLYIAFHGSWNRSPATGYKIVRVPLQNGQVAGPAEDFLTGWLQSDGTVTGRPVGVTFAPDGTLFVSDDKTGTIYHIWHT